MIRSLLALILCAGPAFADPDRVSILLGSQHLGGDGFNEINPGAFLTWEDRALGLDYSVGAYLNSYDRISVAATVDLALAEWDRGRLSVFAGVAHYPRNGRNFKVHAGDFVPIGGVQVRQGNVFMQILPSDGLSVDATVAFGVTFSIK